MKTKPSVYNRLNAAVTSWIEIMGTDDGIEGFIDLLDNSKRPSLSLECEYSLPRTDEKIIINVEEFINIACELESSFLEEMKICRTSTRSIYHIDTFDKPDSDVLYSLLPNAINTEEHSTIDSLKEANLSIRELSSRILSLGGLPYPAHGSNDEVFELYRQKQKLLEGTFSAIRSFNNRQRQYVLLRFRFNEQDISCFLTKGITLFGTTMAKMGLYHKHFPPATPDDWFVEVVHSGILNNKDIDSIFFAYVFELSSSISLRVKNTNRPYYDYSFDEIDVEREFNSGFRLRPLLTGAGLSDVLNLYHRALGTDDSDFRILSYAKIIEYISQTVVRLQINEVIKQKLGEQKTLDADAEYISELEKIITGQEKIKRDDEAMKLAIKKVCSCDELSKIAPNFLNRLKSLKNASAFRDQQDALSELSRKIYSTRNSIVHAKANYINDGHECPEDERLEFALFLSVVAQQAIRWFANIKESDRVVSKNVTA